MASQTEADPLEQCGWPDLPPRYAAALRAALAFIFGRFTPLGVIACGSILRGNPDRSSDLDIHVIHAAPYKQRLQRWFTDVPAEIFVNPPLSIREYFVAEHRRARSSTAHMLATGFVVFHAHAVVDLLRAEAAEWLAKRSRPSADEDMSERHGAATLLDDAVDLADRDPPLASALLGEAVLAMLRYYLQRGNGVLPRPKDLFAALAATDAALAADAIQFFAHTSLPDRLAVAYRIADSCMGARGFFEWESEQIPVADGADVDRRPSE